MENIKAHNVNFNFKSKKNLKLPAFRWFINLFKQEKWEVFLSFHYDWWNNKNIDNFKNIFKKCRNIYISDNDKNIQPGQLVDYIKKHPFCSIYMNF